MVLDVSRPATVRRILNWINLFWAPVSLSILLLTLVAVAMTLFPFVANDDSVSLGNRLAASVAFAVIAIFAFSLWVLISRLHPRAYALIVAVMIAVILTLIVNSEVKHGEYRREIGQHWFGLRSSLDLIVKTWRIDVIWSPWGADRSASEVIAISALWLGLVWLSEKLAHFWRSTFTSSIRCLTLGLAIAWAAVAFLRFGSSPSDTLIGRLKEAGSVLFSNSGSDDTRETAIARFLSGVFEQLGVGFADLGRVLSPIVGLAGQAIVLWIVVLLIIAVARYPFYLWSFSRAQWTACKFPVPKGFLPTVLHALGMAPISYMTSVGTPLSTVILGFAKLALGAGVAAILVLFGFSSWLVSSERPEAITPLWRNVELSTQLAGGAAAAFSVIVLGVLLARLAREVVPRGYVRTRERDPRPPILFLRSFARDRGELDGDAPHAEMPPNLEALLLNLAGAYGPVVALGAPKDRGVRSGAGRMYVHPQHWQQNVLELTQEATLVVAFVDSTPGIRWEIELLLRGDAKSKSLFLLNPQLARAAAGDIRRDPVLAHSSALKGRIPIGVFHSPDKTILIVSENVKTGDYQCALSSFLLIALGHPEGAVAKPVL